MASLTANALKIERVMMVEQNHEGPLGSLLGDVGASQPHLPLPDSSLVPCRSLHY
jgi:hypothetical protein